ncbi:MAG: CPBP family intramembrane metalloprotease [Chloroflexi bacterium]|nr:CPBP family intramembrane metalloprotease [Chloroflexota bacterium]
MTADRREMSLRQKLAIVEEPPPWGLPSATLALLALFLCLTVVGPALASIVLGSANPSPALLMLSWTLGMILCSAFVLVSRRSSPASWKALRLRRGKQPLALAMLFGVAIGLTLDLLIGLLGGRFLPMPTIFGLPEAGAEMIILGALLAVLVQPIAETLVFQALLLPALRSRLGAWAGVIITSALMTLLHLLVFVAALPDAYQLLWHGIVLPAALAFAFCLLRVLADSSLAVILGRMGAGMIFLLTALTLGS